MNLLIFYDTTGRKKIEFSSKQAGEGLISGKGGGGVGGADKRMYVCCCCCWLHTHILIQSTVKLHGSKRNFES